MALFETFEEECCAALPATLEKHLAQSEAMKSSGSPSFWKPREAVMLALGTVHKSVEKKAVKRQLVNFDISAFLENVVMADIVNPGKPRRSRGGFLPAAQRHGQQELWVFFFSFLFSSYF